MNSGKLRTSTPRVLLNFSLKLEGMIRCAREISGLGVWICTTSFEEEGVEVWVSRDDLDMFGGLGEV